MEIIKNFIKEVTTPKFYQSMNDLEENKIINIIAGFYINGKNNTKILIVVDDEFKKYFADGLNKRLFSYNINNFVEYDNEIEEDKKIYALDLFNDNVGNIIYSLMKDGKYLGSEQNNYKILKNVVKIPVEELKKLIKKDKKLKKKNY